MLNCQEFMFSGFAEFDKTIATSAKTVSTFSSNFPVHLLVDLVNINETERNPKLEPDKKFIYIDIASVSNGTGEISLDNEIIGNEAPSRARRYAFDGSVLISTVRPNLKAFAYIDKEIPNAVYSTGFAVLRSKNEKVLMNKYLYLIKILQK